MDEFDLSPYFTGMAAGQNPGYLSGAMGGWGQLLLDPLQARQLAMLDKQGAMYDRMALPQGKFTTGIQNFGTIAQGLAGLGSMWLGYQALRQQREAFKFNKGVVNTNLNNGILDYNRRLTDTLTNRSLNNGQGQAYVSSELAKWQAKRSN